MKRSIIRFFEESSLPCTIPVENYKSTLIENSIRLFAIGRKNYLFAGSHKGARRAAMLYSFLGTCKMHKVNPFEWQSSVLARIPSHKANRLAELQPQN